MPGAEAVVRSGRHLWLQAPAPQRTRAVGPAPPRALPGHADPPREPARPLAMMADGRGKGPGEMISALKNRARACERGRTDSDAGHGTRPPTPTPTRPPAAHARPAPVRSSRSRPRSPIKQRGMPIKRVLPVAPLAAPAHALPPQGAKASAAAAAAKQP